MPEIHPEAFSDTIPSLTSRTLAAVKSSGDSELDQQLCDATCEEVQLSFVKAHFLASALLDGALVSPRFGLRQKNKLRLIDDLSISGLNMWTSLPERQKVASKCVGKTYDLRKAYRRLAIREDHLHLAWIAVWSPEHQAPMVFSMDSLPFGFLASSIL